MDHLVTAAASHPMKRLPQLALTLPEEVDRRETTGWIWFYLSLLVLLVMLPTGTLFENEEYYFQVAAQFLSPEAPARLSAIMESSRHLFMSSIVIGLPVQWLGYETAAVALRIATGLALAFALARLASVWRLSALDAVLAVAIFMLLDQQYFGDEWIIRAVEGKVFAYILVCLGLSAAFAGRWKACASWMIAATWFHFLVGGFWMLASLAWFLSSREQARSALHAFLVYTAGVLPLAALIAWQRAQSAAHDPSIDTWYVFAVLRMPHHVAPFSSHSLIWSWTPGIVMLLCTMVVSVGALALRVEPRVRRLVGLVIGLQVYLFLALLASSTEAGVRLIGHFFVFRPSSLTLLLAIAALLVVYRQHANSRLSVWLAAWLFVPAMSWSTVKEKVQEVVGNPVEPAELQALVDAVGAATGAGEVVLVQPGRDDEHPELSLSRRLGRPTLVNWDFAPTLPADIEEWTKRQQFRVRVFESGCEGEQEYPIGAMILYNPAMPPDPVVHSCGEIVWAGDHYSVLDTG